MPYNDSDNYIPDLYATTAAIRLKQQWQQGQQQYSQIKHGFPKRRRASPSEMTIPKPLFTLEEIEQAQEFIDSMK